MSSKDLNKIKLKKVKITKENIDKSYSNISPHPILRSSCNIKWYRNRSTSKMIAKSLNQFYGSNEELKVMAQPKYLFAESTFEKISKLKYLFGQFDKDKSKTLELKEIEHMFKLNKIPMNMTNLENLFFKSIYDDDKLSQKCKDNIDFNTLVNYAISNQTDEKYRKLMRNIKDKISTKEKEDLYIPMTFNSLLEHFNNKGEIREKINDVTDTIKRMEKIINIKDDTKKLIHYENYNKKLNKEISFFDTVKNFEDIVKVSSKNLSNGILSGSNCKRQVNSNFNTINYNTLNVDANTNISNKDVSKHYTHGRNVIKVLLEENSSLPVIESTLYTNLGDTRFESIRPNKIDNFYCNNNIQLDWFKKISSNTQIVNLKNSKLKGKSYKTQNEI